MTENKQKEAGDGPLKNYEQKIILFCATSVHDKKLFTKCHPYLFILDKHFLPLFVL